MFTLNLLSLSRLVVDGESEADADSLLKIEPHFNLNPVSDTQTQYYS